MPQPALSQNGAAPAADRAAAATEAGTADDVIISARRIAGSAIGDATPIAVLDPAAIRAMGATNMKELVQRLKGLTASASGGAPIFLLNGRRTAAPEEIWELPPEAIERTEILPEQDAARFGFPPTQRVMNFITKKQFRSVATQQLAGTTTEGGGGTNYLEMIATRLSGSRRLSVNASWLRQNPVQQDSRAILPDPDIPFALTGNVAAAGGGSIDPALDHLVGDTVKVAALPTDSAGRRNLAAYTATANRPAITDIGRYRTLQPRIDTVKADATFAAPIADAVSGSLTLGMEAQQTLGRNGLAAATLRVPGGGVLPFAGDTLVSRYFADTTLHQRSTNLKLNAGGGVHGLIGRWSWHVTGSYDHSQSSTYNELGIPTDALQASITAGGDPLQPLDAAETAARLATRRRGSADNLTAKATANGPLVRLPAGDALVTVTGDYMRGTGTIGLANGSDRALARTTSGASINATVPVTAPDQGVLSFVGRLTLNGTIGISDVSGYGSLVRSTYGLTWAIDKRIQFTASIDLSQTPPDLMVLTLPILSTPNTPFFDFVTGTTATVTTISGGNPLLLPERRHAARFGVSLTPFADGPLRLSVDYVDRRTVNQMTSVGSATSAFQSAFPELFQRNDIGQLTRVDLRSINVAEERERSLQFTGSIFTQLGKKPAAAASPAGGAAKVAPPPKPPKPRPYLYASTNATLRLEDTALLRAGLPTLDLLDGATLNGTGGRPRWEVTGDIGGSFGPVNLGTYTQLQGPTRVRNSIAASDLHFSGRTWIVAYGSLHADQVVHQPWAKNTTLNVTVENLLNDRIDVRDRTGATPNRFQAAYLDPLGRSIRLGVRKLF
ncbi:TonB-dependent receptor [Sphingomonas sp. MA1305]|nr:TonB-dependent receptor [Sphingomonas sp. MA1305]